MAWRILCAFLFLALTAERDRDPLLYNGTWRSPLSVFAPLFDSIPGTGQRPWNLLLLALVPVSLLLPGSRRRRPWPLDAAIGLSFLTSAAALVWGLARGGSGQMAYHQAHSFAFGLCLALVLLGISKTPVDVRVLGRTVLAAALVRGCLALYYFFRFVRGTEAYPPHMTSHDDSPLFVAGIVILLAWAIARVRSSTWLWVLPGLSLLLMAMKVNNRRAAWFELALAVLFMYLSPFDRKLRRRLNRWALVAVPVLALYAAVGWGRPGALFAPLRAFESSTGDTQDSSALARNEENLNLVFSFLHHPIAGSGWGHPMQVVSDTLTVRRGAFATMWPYLPHNSLVGVVVFTGLVGLFGILAPIPIAAFLGARALRLARTPIDRAAALAGLCMLPVFMLQAYVDIGFQSAVPCLLLGAALSVCGRVAGWTGAWPRARRRRQPEFAPSAQLDAGAASGPEMPPQPALR